MIKPISIKRTQIKRRRKFRISFESRGICHGCLVFFIITRSFAQISYLHSKLIPSFEGLTMSSWWIIFKKCCIILKGIQYSCIRLGIQIKFWCQTHFGVFEYKDNWAQESPVSVRGEHYQPQNLLYPFRVKSYSTTWIHAFNIRRKIFLVVILMWSYWRYLYVSDIRDLSSEFP